MPKKCCVCGSLYNSEDPDSSYHMWPTTPERSELWKKRLGIKHLNSDARCLFICSDHFAKDQFYIRKWRTGYRRFLNNTAEPKQWVSDELSPRLSQTKEQGVPTRNMGENFVDHTVGNDSSIPKAPLETSSIDKTLIKGEKEECQISVNDSHRKRGRPSTAKENHCFLPAYRDETEASLECQICLKVLPSFLAFRTHLVGHTQANNFHCLKCPYVCLLINDFQVHMEKVHGIPYLFKLITDAEPADDSNGDTNSVKEAEPFRCPLCFEHFDSTENYVDHACTKATEYCCGHCSVVFYSLDELDEHICRPQNIKDESSTFPVKVEPSASPIKGEPSGSPVKVEPIDGGDFKSIYIDKECWLVKNEPSDEIDVADKMTDQDGGRQRIIENLDCEGCGFQAYNIKESLAHANSCKKFKNCPYCSYRTDTVRKLDMHCYTVHNCSTILSCDHCKFITSEEDIFKAHILQHNRESVPVNAEEERPVDQITSVINIDSDSDDEFVETNSSRIVDSPRVANVVREVSAVEACDMIAQGVQVVSHSNWPLVGLESSVKNLTASLAEPKEGAGNLVDKYAAIASSIQNDVSFDQDGENPCVFSKNLETVKTVTKNNCIVILDDEDEELQFVADNDDPKETTVFDNNYYSNDSDTLVKDDGQTSSMLRSDQNSPVNTTINGIKKPPSAFYLFYARFKSEISGKFPNLKGKHRREFILTCWRDMAIEDKKCFMEESYLLRMLFYRNHPELIPKRTRKYGHLQKASQGRSSISDSDVRLKPIGTVDEIVLE